MIAQQGAVAVNANVSNATAVTLSPVTCFIWRRLDSKCFASAPSCLSSSLLPSAFIVIICVCLLT